MYSKEELANDFRKLGIKAAYTVMLHASLRAAGEVAGGPDQIHLALKAVLTFGRHSDDGRLLWRLKCGKLIC